MEDGAETLFRFLPPEAWETSGEAFDDIPLVGDDRDLIHELLFFTDPDQLPQQLRLAKAAHAHDLTLAPCCRQLLKLKQRLLPAEEPVSGKGIVLQNTGMQRQIGNAGLLLPGTVPGFPQCLDPVFLRLEQCHIRPVHGFSCRRIKGQHG